MLECKSGKNVVTDPAAVEAGKWAEAYSAQYCALIRPEFGEEVQLLQELITHKVSGWTVDDLVTAIEARLDPLELQACFAPSFAHLANPIVGQAVWLDDAKTAIVLKSPPCQR